MKQFPNRTYEDDIMTTTDPYTTIIRALREQGYTVGTTTVGAKASCPAHDDHGRGLELRRRPDGSVLLRCDRCDPDAILHALGLPVDLLDPDPGSRSCDLEPGSFALPNAPVSEEPEPTSRADGLPAIPTAASAAPCVPSDDVVYEDNALVLAEHLTFERWTEIGETLGRIDSARRWWIGDWINFGERVYARGEKYTQSMDVTGLSYESLRHCGRIAATFGTGRRRPVSWSHHEAVAALDEPEQDRLLDQAVDEGLSRRALRELVPQQITPVSGVSVRHWYAESRDELKATRDRLRRLDYARLTAHGSYRQNAALIKVVDELLLELPLLRAELERRSVRPELTIGSR